MPSAKQRSTHDAILSAARVYGRGEFAAATGIDVAVVYADVPQYCLSPPVAKILVVTYAERLVIVGIQRTPYVRGVSVVAAILVIRQQYLLYINVYQVCSYEQARIRSPSE